MDSSKSSTGAAALQALKDDPEIVALILDVGRLYRGEASAVVQDAIVRSFSTSALTEEYRADRPTGLEFFKYELNRIIQKKEF